MQLILSLVAGLGIGSLLTSIATYFMTRHASVSDRWYREKREAYLGLLTALHEAAVRSSDENSKAYALWQTRCALFGSIEVAKYAQQLVDTNEGPYSERNAAFQNLLKSMRADLHG